MRDALGHWRLFADEKMPSIWGNRPTSFDIDQRYGNLATTLKGWVVTTEFSDVSPDDDRYKSEAGLTMALFWAFPGRLAVASSHFESG
jgi:hypothetical protein